MSQRSKCLPTLLLLATLATLATPMAAIAAPIRVTVVGDTNSDRSELLSPLNSIVHDGIISQSTLPEDFPANAFNASWQVSSSSGYASGDGQPAGHALLTFIFDRSTDGAPAAGSPSVSMKAFFDGEILNDPSGRPEGHLTLTSLETSLANWSADSEIPRSVIDAFLNPQATSIRAYAAGGRPGYVQVELSVQSVPEPAAWAAWALLGVGAIGIRRGRSISKD